jgi:hypothetical protein
MSHRRCGNDGQARAHPGAGDPQAIWTAADVRHLISEEITLLRANPDLEPLRKARQVAQLARVALHAIETDLLAARLEAIEAALRVRKDTRTPKETSP